MIEFERLRIENRDLRAQLSAADDLLQSLINLTSAAMLAMRDVELALRSIRPDIADTARVTLAKWRELLANIETAERLSRATNIVVPDSERAN